MAEYTVKVPFTGYYKVWVQANSEEEAIAEAKHLPVELAIANEEALPTIEIVDWKSHDKVILGNMFCGVLKAASAQKLEEEEE